MNPVASPRQRFGRSGNRAAAVAALCGLSLAGCLPKPKDPGFYFPLAVGNSWTYDEVTPSGAKSETLQIIRTETGSRSETRYIIGGPLSGEGKPRYYLRSGQTIALSISEGIWAIFLQGPLQVGHRFDAGLTTNEGFTVKGDPDGAPFLTVQRPDQDMLAIPGIGYKVVTGLDRSVTVPAGTFRDCLEIAHFTGVIVGVKYYAPRVGMVLAEAWTEDRSHTKRMLLSRQALTQFLIKDDR